MTSIALTLPLILLSLLQLVIALRSLHRRRPSDDPCAASELKSFRRGTSASSETSFRLRAARGSSRSSVSTRLADFGRETSCDPCERCSQASLVLLSLDPHCLLTVLVELAVLSRGVCSRSSSRLDHVRLIGCTLQSRFLLTCSWQIRGPTLRS